MAKQTARELAIESLLRKVEEVLNNNGWPTEEGQYGEDGVLCPIQELVNEIRKGA